MSDMSDQKMISQIAPAGHYLALRVGFAFPLEEVNALPNDWVEHYTRQGFMMQDPVIRWIYANTGAVRWSDIKIDDPRNILLQAKHFGLVYGAAISCFDNNPSGQRSFGSFLRADREYNNDELEFLSQHVLRKHIEYAPPTNLTNAELEALKMLKAGMRLKQIAHELGVTEGAIKQRLRNAKRKLSAATSAQAASLASDFGLI
ncbi:MAG: autoinducer binding domain-containing protein [Rhodobacteraceae bacterium]|nr:autoinducer binding domain-containing protein [Paracoccaceae bacterium]